MVHFYIAASPAEAALGTGIARGLGERGWTVFDPASLAVGQGAGAGPAWWTRG